MLSDDGKKKSAYSMTQMRTHFVQNERHPI